MSSSTDGRPQGRVVREKEGSTLPMASIASPRGTMIVYPSSNATGEGLDFAERLAVERRAGFEEGRVAALSDAYLDVELKRSESVKAMTASVASACLAVARDRSGVVDEVVSEAVDLAFELTEMLLGEELSHRDSPVHAAVARAVAMAPDGQDLRIRIHPGATLTPDELAELSSVSSVTVVADSSIEPTGCVVEAGACRIDAQIRPALDRVRSVLEQIRSNAQPRLSPDELERQ
jgi:flagellar biosynthesis/type III secretory pathway protein FliH